MASMARTHRFRISPFVNGRQPEVCDHGRGWCHATPESLCRPIHIPDVLTHAQASSLPSASVIQQIVDFENGIYSAQVVDDQAGSLTAFGATGGPSPLWSGSAGLPAAPNTFSNYLAWSNPPSFIPDVNHRASVARGEAIFNSRLFVISRPSRINDLAGGDIPGTCATCHSNTNDGNDVCPQAQLEEGTSGSPFAIPAPIFHCSS
jgi:hypothetical protein